MPARPYEGRISRMIGPNQLVRCVVKDGRIKYVPFTPKIEIEMDKVKEHVNLPSETHDNFQDPAKMAQLQSPQLENIRQRPAEGGEPMKSLPHSEKHEKPKDPMKDLLVKHTGDLLELTENTRWRQAELQEHRDDLRLLKRKVDYTTPLLRPPVYYDTLHNIYSTKPPFYYDGENPYEYDYVGPWDYHKTNAIIDQYAKEGKQDETLLQSDASRVHPFDWEMYQFAGSPGKKAYVMPKYTGNQLLNGISRLEQSVAQKPIPQSNYVHSYNPDRVKSILTASDGKINLTDLSSSLPTAYTSRRSAPTTAKSVQINGTVRVATGGGDEPLRVTDVPTAYPQDIGENSVRVEGRYTSQAEYDVYRNSHVDARHSNPQGARDRRFDWTADSIHRRDQTKLLDIQDSFTKSNTRDQFHKTFSESAPDLRNNVDTGKSHSFEGVNSYYWH